MKDIKDYIINENEQQIDENFVYPVHLLPPEWQPYAIAMYVLYFLWAGIFFATGFEDATFGISTLKEITKDKFEEFKHKRELKAIKKILDQDEDYIKWSKNKNKRLKDLTPIIKKIRNDSKVKQIIKDIWEESKNI